MSEGASHEVEAEWEGAWYSAKADCAVCGYAWVAVYPECCDALECGKCGHMTRAPHLETLEDEDDDGDGPEPWRA